jgi:ABC-type uncharacterized transport system ATPase subunit
MEVAIVVANASSSLIAEANSDSVSNRPGAELIKSLAGKHTVVVIEHDMEFIRDLKAPVTVLHQGSVLTEGFIDDVKKDPKVIEVYLGQSQD